jgi:hypothetical protein
MGWNSSPPIRKSSPLLIAGYGLALAGRSSRPREIAVQNSREEDHQMKRPMGVALAFVLALGVAGSWSPAEAKQNGGLAKLDQLTTPGS